MRTVLFSIDNILSILYFKLKRDIKISIFSWMIHFQQDNCAMDVNRPLKVIFFKTEHGSEPVRKWLKELSREDRKAIGEDIKAVQYGWPIGLPLRGG